MKANCKTTSNRCSELLSALLGVAALMGCGKSEEFAVAPRSTPVLIAEGDEWYEDLMADATNRWRAYSNEQWPESWALEEGMLRRAAEGGDIMTVEEYDDFDLRLQWKITPGGNSGIMFRVSTGDDAPYYSGAECQVLDDENHKDGGSTLTSTGALYGLYSPAEKSVRSVGQWNDVRIVAEGNHVVFWLNDVKVVDCEIGSDDWNERLAESKFADWPKFAKNRQGHIALQDHGDEVWYRNVRIRRLNDKP